MTVDAVTLKRLIENELAKLSDTRVEQYIRGLLVEPTPLPRDWDYGRPGQQYVCWTVLQHAPSNSAIAYREDGFGPAAPWGLLSLSGDHMSMGMDSGWFSTILQLSSSPWPRRFFLFGVCSGLTHQALEWRSAAKAPGMKPGAQSWPIAWPTRASATTAIPQLILNANDRTRRKAKVTKKAADNNHEESDNHYEEDE